MNPTGSIGSWSSWPKGCSMLKLVIIGVQHLSLLAAATKREGEDFSSVNDSLESGGEDWPSAYRYTPMIPAQALLCIVVFCQCG